jgi:hypothetical protein
MTQDNAVSRRGCVRVLLHEPRQTKNLRTRSRRMAASGGTGSISIAPGRQEIRKAKRRQTRVPSIRITGCGRAPDLLRLARVRGGQGGARSPVGVPPRRLRQRTNAAAQLQHALPGTRSGRTIPMVRKTVRGSAGVTRAVLSQSSELLADRSSCRPGVKPEPPESASDEPPPAGTALAPAAGVTRMPSCRWARFATITVSETGTSVNENVTPFARRTSSGRRRVVSAEGA